MSHSESDLANTIPSFDHEPVSPHPVGLAGMTGLASSGAIRNGRDALVIALIAVGLIAGLQILLTVTDTKSYVMPKPTEIGEALYTNFDLFWPHILSTMRVLVIGYAIGAAVGLLLAATITPASLR